ncbi:hypothetical protein [Candidatus Phytoplasma palmae]|uniref:hypothetical protein n=1 Tax=Candidatus Phytoplasma palmae TaxID=85624 RepID=UPI003990BF0B
MLKKEELNKNNNKLNYCSFIVTFFVFFSSIIILSLTPNVVLASNDSNVDDCNNNTNKESLDTIDTTKQFSLGENKNIIKDSQESEETTSDNNPLAKVEEYQIKDIISTEQTDDITVLPEPEKSQTITFYRTLKGSTQEVTSSSLDSIETKSNLATSKTIFDLTLALREAYNDASHKRTIRHATSLINDDILDVKRWGFIKVDRFTKEKYDYDGLKDVIIETVNGIYEQALKVSKTRLDSEYQYILDFLDSHYKSVIDAAVNSLWYQ